MSRTSLSRTTRSATAFRAAAALALVLGGVPSFRAALAQEQTGEWRVIFDGKSLDGWRINESPESWKLADGVLVAHGTRSHIFYVGDDKPFVNFEFKAEVMTKPGSNGGIFFHTQFQESGWPAQGYESQVNISQGDPQKTGGLYNTVKVLTPPAKDNTWWEQHIIVQGKRIIVKIDGETVVDYVEPDNVEGTVRLSKGTFALQAHDPNSVVSYRNIRVKRLP